MKNIVILIVAVILTAAANFLIGGRVAASENGNLTDNAVFDASFGSGGIVITDIAGSDDKANSVALQPDGKIVAAGRGGRWGVARYNTDGSLDTTFDTDGKVTISLTGTISAQEVFVLSDGRIVVAGTTDSGNGYAVARLNANGSLDTTFGASGIALYSFGTGITPAGNAGILQPDGKIIVAGHLIYSNPTTNIEDWAAVRFNADGSLDTTFGTGGKVVLDINYSDEAFGAKLQTDGKIVIAGLSAPNGASGNLTLARLNTDGSPDTTFGANGKAISPFAGSFATSLAIQADGKILAAGSVFSGNKDDFTAERYNADGTIDTTFGTNGRVVSVLSASSNRANDVVFQTDGKFILSGYAVVGGTQQFALARYNAGGTLDTTFSGDGIQTTSIRLTSAISQTVVQPDGKILSVGIITPAGGSGNTNDFALVRYDADGTGPTPTPTPTITPTPTPTPTPAGTFDTTFNATGKNIFNFGGTSAQARALKIQTDGKLVLGGSAAPNGSGVSNFALARLNANGSLDTTFNATGKVLTIFNSASVINALALQTDGKIVAAGSTVITDSISALARYNADGSLDTTFGSGGFVTTQPIGGSKPISEARDVVVQTDGKIVVTGRAYNAVGTTVDGFFIIRYNANGSLDTTFGANGIVLVNFNNNYEFGTAVVLQTDGKIVAAGINNGNFVALVRYTANGTLDTTYNGTGKIVTTISTSDNAKIVVQPDGKVIAGGAGNPNFVAQRFNADGSRDNSYNASFSTIVNFNTAFVYSLALQADGKLVGAGGLNSDFYLFRTLQNGVLDASFGTGGKLSIDVAGSNQSDQANAVAVQPDGKIVAAGLAYSNSNGVMNMAVLRIYPGGANVAPQKAGADFDGDGKSDLSVFRPSNAVWYSQNSTNGFSAQAWGLSTDKLTPADYDGDGKTDTAVWREDAANPDFSYFYILQSATNTVRAAQFGRINDNPYFSGDWDGDGKADPTVFRDTGAGQTFFYYQPSTQPTIKFISVPWGISGDKPARGDFDGDGKQDAAVFRPSNGVWYILQSSNNQLRAESWGTAGDKLIAADYDGDGKTDLAVLRGTNWYIRQSTDAAFKAYNWGNSTDTSVPADYDGDGKTDVAVYRSGAWYIIQSSNSQIRIDNFGQANDIPIPLVN